MKRMDRLKEIARKSHEAGAKDVRAYQSTKKAEDADMYEDMAADLGYERPSDAENMAVLYAFTAAEEALHEATGNDKILISHPKLNATLSLIPLLGPWYCYGMGLDQIKGVPLTLIDIIVLVFSAPMLFVPYIIFKVLMFKDVLELSRRAISGRELGDWEFFWNEPG
jgi:hypothetical protein